MRKFISDQATIPADKRNAILDCLETATFTRDEKLTCLDGLRIRGILEPVSIPSPRAGFRGYRFVGYDYEHQTWLEVEG